MEPQNLISLKAAFQKKRMPLYMMAIPSFRELEDPSSALATEVLGSNNEVLGRYFVENRVPVSFEDLSPHLVSALISTEDERFREHCGIDGRAVARVVILYQIAGMDHFGKTGTRLHQGRDPFDVSE